MRAEPFKIVLDMGPGFSFEDFVILDFLANIFCVCKYLILDLLFYFAILYHILLVMNDFPFKIPFL